LDKNHMLLDFIKRLIIKW